MSPRPLFLRGDRLMFGPTLVGNMFLLVLRRPLCPRQRSGYLQLLCKDFMGCWYNHQYHRRNFSYFFTYYCSLLWEIFTKKMRGDREGRESIRETLIDGWAFGQYCQSRSQSPDKCSVHITFRQDKITRTKPKSETPRSKEGSTPALLGKIASAAKSLQLCPTLCNPIDGSPPGSPVPGILQARTLEWVAISFSSARED